MAEDTDVELHLLRKFFVELVRLDKPERDLTLRQIAVALCVGSLPAQTAGKLKKRLGLHSTVARRVVDRLITLGLAAEAGDTASRRRVQVCLTNQGLKLLLDAIRSSI